MKMTKEGAVELMIQGIEASDRGDHHAGLIAVGVSQRYLEELGEKFDAGVARDWFNTIIRRRQPVTA